MNILFLMIYFKPDITFGGRHIAAQSNTVLFIFALLYFAFI